MTEKLYLKDSYVKEFEAKVTSVNQDTVELDSTAFFPTGGGQLCDTGTIMCYRKNYKVIEVKKLGDSVLHILENAEGLAVGDMVKGTIDWKRRYALMRLHTALHVMDAVVVKNYSNGQITGGQIYEHKARIDFDMEGVSRELVEKIIAESQKIVDEGHPVTIRFLSKDEAAKVEGLARTAPGAELRRRERSFCKL